MISPLASDRSNRVLIAVMASTTRPGSQMTHIPTRFLRWLPILLSLLLCPSLSVATDLELVGGPGGHLFRAECPQGSYLVGLAGRTGEWVDRIAPICAPWLRGSQSFGPPAIGPSFGASTGGQDRQRTCWAAGNKTFAVQSWYVETVRSANPPVQYIEIHCVSLSPPQAVGLFDFGNPTPASEERLTKGPYPHGCQPGEIASGFRVRAGLFVDSLGLICAPVPARVGTPAGKLPTPLVQSPPPASPMAPQAKNLRMPEDLFVITKPVPGERVPQGQLLITAMAPKVGVTSVSELELRYLDAPSLQKDAYPYVTITAVDTTKLTQGYLVPPLVTGAYPGRWHVRARSAMKTTPGPWSHPVQFTIEKSQTPPPMMQMQRPNLPVTQAPPQGAGIAPSVVRPPATSSQGSAAGSLLVRPRGAEQETGQKANQTLDQPPSGLR